MNCDEVIIELDAYLTGELDPNACGEIESHLKQCSTCDAELHTLQNENALYRDYRSAVEVPAGAWPSVQAELHPYESVQSKILRPWRIWAAAASILLALGLSWYVYQKPVAPDLSQMNDPGSTTTLSPQVVESVKNLQQALDLLQAAYLKKKPELDPELVKELDRNLDLTRMAIEECEQALKENPSNTQVVEFLLMSYEKQIDMLTQITEEL